MLGTMATYPRPSVSRQGLRLMRFFVGMICEHFSMDDDHMVI